MKSAFALLALSPLALAAPETSQSSCREVLFSVSGTAQNKNITGINAAFNNISALTQALTNQTYPNITVSGPQNLAGWYCLPARPNANSTKLQLFFNSITSNREMWTAQGGTGLKNPPNSQYQPQTYSWVDYANKLGYPTLSIDLLGQGKSSHPDPVIDVQYTYEAVLYHDLVNQIKTGTTGQLPFPYQNINLIGNSYGSELAVYMAQQYPTDFTQMVLTGWSTGVIADLPGILLLTPQPAAIVDPSRFAGFDPGYVTTPNETTRTNSFYGNPNIVNFTQTQADLFFQRKDVVSIGQLFSIYVMTAPSPAYKGRVLVLDGAEDQAFCGLGSSDLSPDTQCSPLFPAAVGNFPNAQANAYSVPASGHALILHTSAPTTLKVAHQFLAGAEFPVA